MKYLMIQRLEGDKWVNYTCHYFCTQPAKVLLQYDAIRHKEPDRRFRIVHGRATIDPVFERLFKNATP